METITDLSELQEARIQVEQVSRQLAEIHQLDNIIGKSHSMQIVFTAIKAASSSNATILIQGESGTGKELVANAIHYNGERRNHPLITVNCSALSENLLESELFGHIKGSFTGAIKDRIGRFEEAEGGTIFLDEIGEISPYIQVKLLRVLQEREIERVGESKTRKIDIRIITASNKNLFDLVKSGEFREDLYYRLKVFPINVPTLKERKDDIPALTHHFLKLYNRSTAKNIKRISHQAMQVLLDYHWPGNVRELENAIEHAFVLCDGEEVDIFDLPVELRKTEYQHIPPQQPAPVIHKPRKPIKFNRDELLQLLNECDWNKAEVARRIGLSRTAVWKYMKKWDIPLQRSDI